MEIYERRFQTCVRASSSDRFDDDGKAAGVVAMPMRQEDALDRRQFDSEARCVVEPCISIRADVEQDASQLVSASSSQQHRQPVTRDAQMLKHTHSGVSVVVASWWQAVQKRGHLGNLVDSGVDARQGIGLVVDHDDHLEVVQYCEVIHAHRTRLLLETRLLMFSSPSSRCPYDA